MSLQEAASSGSFNPRAAQPTDPQPADAPFGAPRVDDAVDQATADAASPFGASYDYAPSAEETLAGGSEPDMRATRRRAWTVIGLAIVIPAAVAGIIAWQLFGTDSEPAPTVTRVTTTPAEAVAQPVATATTASVEATAAAPETDSTTVAAATTSTVEVTTTSTATEAETTVATAAAAEPAVDLASLDPAARLAAWTDIQTIEVLPGETLWLIAQNYDTTISAIVTLNDLADPEMLSVGQTLMIPVGFAEEIVAEAAPVAEGGSEVVETGDVSTVVSSTPVEAPAATDDLTNWHTIAPVLIEDGDSLAAIADANNTTVEAIMALNGIADPDLIYVGTEIQVPIGYQGSASVAQVSDSLETSTPASAPADTSDDMMEDEPAGGSDDMMSE